MSALVSERLHCLRQKFRQFEHGGQAFGSDEISAIVRELADMTRAAKVLEDTNAGLTRGRPGVAPKPMDRPLPAWPAALPIGTLFFMPAGAQPIGGA